jgi:hypothetical protein
MAAAAPPPKGKGKQIFGLSPTLFWGGLGVLGLGVAYFIYKRNAAKGQQGAPTDTQMLPVAVAGGTGLTSAQLFTWIHDHQGHPRVKPWPVDKPRKRKRRHRGRGDD